MLLFTNYTVYLIVTDFELHKQTLFTNYQILPKRPTDLHNFKNLIFYIFN